MDIGPLVRVLLAQPVNEPVPEVITSAEAPQSGRIDVSDDPALTPR